MYVVSVTGEKQPIELRYAGRECRVNRWETIGEYRMDEVFKVGMEADGGWMPPLTDVYIRIKP